MAAVYQSVSLGVSRLVGSVESCSSGLVLDDLSPSVLPLSATASSLVVSCFGASSCSAPGVGERLFCDVDRPPPAAVVCLPAAPVPQIL